MKTVSASLVAIAMILGLALVQGCLGDDIVYKRVCDVPDGYTIVAKACTPTCSTCVAQDSPFLTPPPAHQVTLAECVPPTRLDLLCVDSCEKCPAIEATP